MFDRELLKQNLAKEVKLSDEKIAQVLEQIEKVSLSNELSASEALYGFCGWLTTCEKPLVMSSKTKCSEVVDAILEFSKANNLMEPRPNWDKNLKPTPKR